MITEKQYEKELEEIKREIEKIGQDMRKNQYMLRCQYALGLLEAKIKIIDEQLAAAHGRDVIRSVSGRVKSPESIYMKLIRKGYSPDFDTAKEKLNDLVGVRIVCLFLDDAYEIADILKRQQDISLVKVKDYIAKPKKNGYMSLHLIVDVPICLDDVKECKRVEIQIRTAAMDFWSVLDYQLLYKKDVSGAEKAARELKGYSEEIAALDKKMLKIRNEIEKI
jgi:putative GTP pyrophosphokinase